MDESPQGALQSDREVLLATCWENVTPVINACAGLYRMQVSVTQGSQYIHLSSRTHTMQCIHLMGGLLAHVYVEVEWT